MNACIFEGIRCSVQKGFSRKTFKRYEKSSITLIICTLKPDIYTQDQKVLFNKNEKNGQSKMCYNIWFKNEVCGPNLEKSKENDNMISMIDKYDCDMIKII